MDEPKAPAVAMTGAERRDAWVAAQIARTGIDEAMIRRLVEDFYGSVRHDPALAPIFKAHVLDWDAHIDTLCDFWSGVALMTGRYKGKPVIKHAPLPVRATHFARWLHLFAQSANRVCPAPAAEFFIDRAERVAESLALGIRQAGGPTVNYVAGQSATQEQHA